MSLGFFLWMFLLKQGSIHQFDSFNCWMIRQKVLKMLVAKDTVLQSYLFISLKSWSAKRFWGFFASVRPRENSVLCYSYVAIPAYEKISCRWCLSLIFRVSHMSIHTRKAHSSSYCTRKTGTCFQTEDFFRSFHQMKQTSVAFADFSWLLCKPNKFCVKASFGLPKSHSWALCTLIAFMGPHAASMEVEASKWVFWELYEISRSGR